MRPSWVRTGVGQLIRQFCNDRGNSAWIGIASLGPFSGAPVDGLLRRGGQFTPLPGLDLAQGFVWQPQSTADQPELWLSPLKAGYRDVFERFAIRYLGAAGLGSADVQIDHVFPKKAGSLGHMAYVRMLAIPPESNMAAGRTLERAMVERNATLGARRKLTRLATYFSIGKATGFTGYEHLPDDGSTAVNAKLAQDLLAHLARFGVSAEVLTPLDQGLLADAAAALR